MPAAIQETFDLLATRFLSGEATSEEKVRFRKYLGTEKWKSRFARMQRSWNAAEVRQVTGFDVAAAAQRLALRIAIGQDPAPITKRRKSKSPNLARATLRKSKKPRLAYSPAHPRGD